jgi:hypothetical protein
MQTFSATLDQQEVAYLIHGQPFNLNFSVNGAAYVLIYYRPPVRGMWWNRFRITKAVGVFSSITNANSPHLHFFAFGSFVSLIPKKFTLLLRVNFLNTVQYAPALRTQHAPVARALPAIHLHAPELPVNEPEYQFQTIHLRINPMHIEPSLIQYP